MAMIGFATGMLLPVALAAVSDLQLAESAYKRDDWTTAIPAYQRYLKDHPRETGAYVRLGDCLRRVQRNNEAIEALTAAIKIKPLCRAHVLRARAYAAQKQNDKALSDFRRALVLEPSDFYLYIDLVDQELKLGQYSAAVSDCTKGIDVATNPSCKIRLLYARSKAYAAMGQKALALQDQALADKLSVDTL